MMKHRKFQQWIVLSLQGDLDPADERLLEAHLDGCAACRREREEYRRVLETVGWKKRVRVTKAHLDDARSSLRVAIRQERSGESRGKAWAVHLFRPFPAGARIAAAGVVSLALGIIGGYVLFGGGPSGAMLPSLHQVGQVEQGKTQISDVHFLYVDPVSGDVELSFEAIRPVRLRGNLKDDSIRDILAEALVNEDNPGLRIKTVSAIAGIAEEAVDPKVKDALIFSVTHDPNPGVRKEAIKGLMKFPWDADIRDALLEVLSKDENQGLRVDAINALTESRPQAATVDQEMLRILKQRVQSDPNNYIRLRAKAMLEEVQVR